jgi:hypothetical protein
VIDYMLQENIKLEQKIVAYKKRGMILPRRVE